MLSKRLIVTARSVKRKIGNVLIESSSPNFCSQQHNFKEVTIPVPWGHIAGKWWGPLDKKPILAVHGWQDNCGSFNRLIPVLDKNLSILAIDWPGHGYSTPIPAGIFRDTMIYPLTICHLMHYFQWPTVSLLGHSLGAITSFIYNIIYPDRVDFTICIDAFKPFALKITPLRMSKNIDYFFKYSGFAESNVEPPSYTLEEIKQKICQPNSNSISYEHSDHIIERNIAPSKTQVGKYYFTRDPRIKTGNLWSWSQEDIVEYTAQVKKPVLICKSTKGSYYEDRNYFYEVLEVLKKSNSDCEFHELEGTHHIHLNNPEVIGSYINDFIKKHQKEEKNTIDILAIQR